MSSIWVFLNYLPSSEVTKTTTDVEMGEGKRCVCVRVNERERDAKWKARVLKNLRKAMTSVEVFDEF